MNILNSNILTLEPWQFAVWVIVGTAIIVCLWLEEGEERFNRGVREVENGQEKV